MDFSSHVFRRGYLLTSSSRTKSLIKVHPVLQPLQGWTATFFGRFQLYYDYRLNYATSRDNAHGVVLLGIAVNPFDGKSDNQSLCDELYGRLKLSEDKFLDYLDELTGSFIVLYRIGPSVKVLQDAAATKPAFYHFSADGQDTVASHTNIAAALHDLEVDPRARKIMSSPLYAEDPSRYLPGMITANSGLMPLFANHLLDLSKKRSERFFPREPIAQVEVTSVLINEIADIFTAQSKLISDKAELYVALTGGRDSRLSFASLPATATATAFTFHNSRSGHLSDDVGIAKRLTAIRNCRMLIGDLSLQDIEIEFKRAFDIHSPIGLWRNAVRFYLDAIPDNAISVRSTISEIGRCFYTKGRAQSLTPKLLANTFTNTPFGQSSDVVSIFAEYIKATDFDEEKFFGYEALDLFYWEHRNSKWQNVLCMEAEMASDVFIPFNNRNLLKKFLSVSRKSRQNAVLHGAVTDKLAPEYRSVPFV